MACGGPIRMQGLGLPFPHLLEETGVFFGPLLYVLSKAANS
jgi:hypothetical protein